MSNIVDQEHIKQFIANGLATIVDVKYCTLFDQYLCDNYPWMPITGYSIDWSKVSHPHSRLRWQEADAERTLQFLQTTCLCNYKEICFVYGAKQPGLLVDIDFAFQNLNDLIIFGIATRFMVGVKRDKYGIIQLIHNCFVEAIPVSWLSSPMKDGQ
jgi:hypothetical protein